MKMKKFIYLGVILLFISFFQVQARIYTVIGDTLKVNFILAKDNNTITLLDTLYGIGTFDTVNAVILQINGTTITASAAEINASVHDTLCFTWGLMDTVTTGDLPGWKVPYDITIIEIASFTDANTTTFNIEERAEATPNTAGTDAMSADQVADNNQQETISFSNAGFARNTWMVPNVSATGDVALLSITVRYIKD